MNPPTILRLCLVGATALVVAAPAGARGLPVDVGNGTLVARYGWGAAATLAKRPSNDLVAAYGWGAAAAYAKQHD